MKETCFGQKFIKLKIIVQFNHKQCLERTETFNNLFKFEHFESEQFIK